MNKIASPWIDDGVKYGCFRSVLVPKGIKWKPVILVKIKLIWHVGMYDTFEPRLSKQVQCRDVETAMKIADEFLIADGWILLSDRYSSFM